MMPAYREWNKISQKDKIIVQKHLNNIPVRLGDIAKELGIVVKLCATLPRNISGQIVKINEVYEIKINKLESRERQRFTLAHEIAHFLLHKDIIDFSKDGIRDNVLYRSGINQELEYAASRLAAQIIMPEAIIKKKYILADIHNDDEKLALLADEFGVSKAAMEIRIKPIKE